MILQHKYFKSILIKDIIIGGGHNMFRNTKSIESSRGFTLVELLIVIVVIAILATITIVAYNGIQNRAKSSAGQSLANVIVKKAAAYQTINSSYPTWCQLTTNRTDTSQTGGTCGATGSVSAGAEAKLDDPTDVVYANSNSGGLYTKALSNNNQVVGYFVCAAGANVFYVDYANADAIIPVKVGPGC